MLKKIKNFFQSIAGKIASGWKWLFSSKANTTQENTSPERPSGENKNKSNTIPIVSTPMQNETEESVSKTDINVEPAENFPEKSNDEPKGVGYIELDEDNYLFLNLEESIKVQDYQGSQNEVEPLFNLLIYLRCDKEEYRITGVGNSIYYCYGISVKSIIKKNRDGNYIDDDKILVQDNIEHVKEMLGLKDDVTEIKVDNISTQPFEGTALEQHNLNPTTSQQTVNNKEVTTESEEFYDAEVTQPSPTIGVSSTERHYVTNPSVNGNGSC
ncbi:MULTISPECIES: hypothetical protein [Wolbachia]|uniref:hypothetical protein n=1 Tax=Wolbachia TaxID=953 RepID=UPI00221E9BEA|nr:MULTISPECIES: hypothetical protein [Wolbachia]BDG75471.1 hypothetical protein wHmt_00290 [Wolbachia pipientis]BDG76896.1 hypothetical protein wHmc_00280 [Wolbachia pipientis]